ncbi:MAG: YncE family protein [Gemmatimonadota bacterium]|nr:YncE family protein [Gemmatimonadota bacterium]
MMALVQTPRKRTVVAFRGALAAIATVAVASIAEAQRQTRGTQPAVPPAAKPANDYWVYVGAESADLVHRVRFGPAGAVVEKTFPVGESPTEMEGPHGLQISKDGKYLHLTTGHGSPDGKYWKYELGPDTLVGPGIFLGYFPASLDVTPDGLYAFVVNFNLHGEMIPSSVSVVYTPTNTEVARIETCTMPHGSRVDPTGARQYSACMMDDQLVEIDTRSFAVSRRFGLAKGREGAIAVAASGAGAHAHDVPETASSTQQAARPQPATRSPKHTMPPATCSPTWAQPSADGSKIYVACNKADEIVEIDRDRWAIERRFPTGRGPYNLAVTPDGKLLVVTLKQGGAVQIFAIATGRSVMQTKSSTTVTHGVVISPDSRYAFVSNEGVGAEPGKVDVYDLRALARVASVQVGQQAGGIAFWKMEAVGR